ncbi:hypothetical protein [Microcella sp.]|uniref:hypothetical protein n=1 Tax=Microcella sp. TaxID=1913979 RepID=UPI003F6F4028
MLRSVYAGSALTAVMLVVMPFLGAADNAAEGLATTGSGSSAPVITAAGSRDDDSAVPLVEYIERRAAADAQSEGDETSDGEHTAQAPVEPGSGSGASGAATNGATGSGSTASGGSGGTSGGGTSGGGTSGGGSTPAPSAPAAPPPPAPPAAPACPAAIGGSTPGAPSRASALGVAGTTSADLQAFAQQYNAIRVANCLAPVPFSNFRFDSCMEDRLFWMAEDPSTDPMSAWGHIGSQRSDGVPSVGCDGNLAGGSGNTGATVAQKWWDSSGHRASLYKPTYTGGTGGVCILFAMTHGGVPNEPYSFTRAAARWVSC